MAINKCVTYYGFFQYLSVNVSFLEMLTTNLILYNICRDCVHLILVKGRATYFSQDWKLSKKRSAILVRQKGQIC